MISSAPDGCVIDGRYRVFERVGAGGAASVYRAADLRLGREVALKVLHPGLVHDGERVERFRREAQSAASLSHPHIAAIYDRGEWDDTHYIAMEYVAGCSLRSIIVEEGPLEQAWATDLTVQLLCAAGAMHGRGIVHRDLKPENLIVDADGRLKVIDFGIARAGPSDITAPGAIYGSAHYLSPEQAEGGEVTGASDLYSAGVVLYEALTGRPPFRGDTAVAVALKHILERPAPAMALNPTLTPELDAAVMRALEKDPGRRFADADGFIEALSEERVARQPRTHVKRVAYATPTDSLWIRSPGHTLRERAKDLRVQMR
jgi:eukaryotic-like serine/threonine-protein kinase